MSHTKYETDLWPSLPDALVLHIFETMDESSLVIAKQVSRRAHDLINGSAWMLLRRLMIRKEDQPWHWARRGRGGGGRGGARAARLAAEAAAERIAAAKAAGEAGNAFIEWRY